MKNKVKKLISIIIILIGLLVFCGCDKKVNENTIDNNTDTYYGYIIGSGYISNMSEDDEKIIITNRQELEEYCNKYNSYSYFQNGDKGTGRLDLLIEKYGDSFFEEKSLAIMYVGLTSGSDSVEFESATKINSNIAIKYHIDRPEIGTCDMSGKLIIVEVDKEITDIL